MNTPTNAAYTQANAPTSDGVNKPMRMPTSRITGKSSAQKHSLKASHTSLSFAFSVLAGLYPRIAAIIHVVNIITRKMQKKTSLHKARLFSIGFFMLLMRKKARRPASGANGSRIPEAQAASGSPTPDCLTL